MNDISERLVACKSSLLTALGENSTLYLNNMKMWFRHKWTKEKFDFESRKFLNVETMHLHNQFFIALLTKLDAFQAPDYSIMDTSSEQYPANSSSSVTASGGSSSSRSRKRKRNSRSNDRVTFEPYDILDYIAEDNLELLRPPPNSEVNMQMLPAQRHCVQELFLPDAGFLLGRFLIGAWEVGLVTVEDNVAEYMARAVKVFLKNLISAIIMKRKHYKVTGEGAFYYDIGAPLRDPSLRNTVTRQKVDDGPLELDKEITSPNFIRRSNEDVIFLASCEEIYPQTNNLITLKDCHRALMDRNLVSSHSVYSINMERLTQMMR